MSTTAALASALAKAQPGDRVLVADGVYDAPVTVSRSGTAGAPITIAAQNAGRAQLTNADAASNKSGNTAVLPPRMPAKPRGLPGRRRSPMLAGCSRTRGDPATRRSTMCCPGWR